MNALDSSRRHALSMAAASAVCVLPFTARAQAWPSKTIRFVVPFAPGGSSEIVARSFIFDDVPTVAEQGFPGFEMTQWYGMLAPANLAPAAADKVAAACAKAVNEPAVVERLTADAAIPVGSSAAEFAKFISAEQQRWKPVIVRAKVKPD